jgi:hypothetical protein
MNIHACLMCYVIFCGRRGRDRMVVGFTITYAIGAYHHNVASSNPAHCGVYSIQHVIKFVSELRQVSGFLWVLRRSPPTATI